ncbi:MAG: hypothetical protein JWN84_3940 [Nocardioides sp.]|nr:hypothetical protein [Nocardioides sp.]
MNPVFPAHKRAEQFSSMVEASSTTRLREGDVRETGKHADLVPLVGLVTSLRATPPVEARAEFVSDLRSRLMLAAETALAPDTAAQLEQRRQPAPRRTARERRLAVAIGGFALVSASASMSVAAQTALPGDTLYPLKRALENAHENVLRDADDKGTTMLANASGRLEEVGELSRTDSQDPEVISQTLQDFADQAVEASSVLLDDYEQTGRLSSIEELRTFTATSLEALAQLESMVPVAARSSLDAAAEVLDGIERLARTICPTCVELPSLVDAVDTAADLGPLYDRLLGDAAELPTPPRPQPTTTPPREPAQPEAQPVTVDEPADEGPAADPGGPGLPTGGEPSGPDNTPTQGPGSLDPVVKGLGTLDLGDLLTGVGETVDDLLGGPGTKK